MKPAHGRRTPLMSEPDALPCVMCWGLYLPLFKVNVLLRAINSEHLKLFCV